MVYIKALLAFLQALPALLDIFKQISGTLATIADRIERANHLKHMELALLEAKETKDTSKLEAIFVASSAFLLSSCEGTIPTWEGKIYAGSSSMDGIERRQDNQVIQCSDPVFDNFVCMSMDDFMSFYDTYVLSCKKWEVRLGTLKAYALMHVGIPYKWGGSNPLEGFDCFGFIQWMLTSVGIDPPGDQTAQALYDFFESKGGRDKWGLGALAFYGKSVREITHVAFCLDNFRMIEFGGGDHTTVDLKTAAKQGACGRVHMIKARKDFLCVIKPSYATIGYP